MSQTGRGHVGWTGSVPHHDADEGQLRYPDPGPYDESSSPVLG